MRPFVALPFSLVATRENKRPINLEGEARAFPMSPMVTEGPDIERCALKKSQVNSCDPE